MNATARRTRSTHPPNSRSEDVQAVDVCAWFSPHLIVKAMTQLWSVVVGRLDPVADDAGRVAVCPITLDTLNDPVEISDGGIYEKASIAQWLQTHQCATCTMRHKWLLKLESLRMVIQDILHAEGSDSYEHILEKVAQDAERTLVPSQDCHVTLRVLQASLTATTNKIIELQEAFSRSEQVVNELQNRISAATCIKTRTRMFAARIHVTLLRKDANRQAVAAALIQKSWLEYRRKRTLREKRRQKRINKHAKAKKQGLDPTDTLSSASNFDTVGQDMSKLDEAEALHRQPWEDFDEAEEKSRLLRAAEFMRFLSETRTKRLGSDHPDTLTSANDLASVLGGMDKHDEAEALYRRTCDARLKKLGSEHLDTPTSAIGLDKFEKVIWNPKFEEPAANSDIQVKLVELRGAVVDEGLNRCLWESLKMPLSTKQLPLRPS